VTEKELKKILKCKDLTREIQRTCDVKPEMVPEMTGQLELAQNHSENI
jgi:hypothetical protein